MLSFRRSLFLVALVCSVTAVASAESPLPGGKYPYGQDYIFPPDRASETVHIQPVGSPEYITEEGESLVDVPDIGPVVLTLKGGKLRSLKDRDGKPLKIVPLEKGKKSSKKSSY